MLEKNKDLFKYCFNNNASECLNRCQSWDTFWPCETAACFSVMLSPVTCSGDVQEGDTRRRKGTDYLIRASTDQVFRSKIGDIAVEQKYWLLKTTCIRRDGTGLSDGTVFWRTKMSKALSISSLFKKKLFLPQYLDRFFCFWTWMCTG